MKLKGTDLELNKVYCSDCLEFMKKLPDKCIDMILCDLPYGTTACSWDIIIPFEQLWKQYKRIIKDNGAIILTASQPFTSALIMSNIEMFKYQWIWKKQKATRFLDCKIRPLQEHEDICVFYKKKSTYNPQMVDGKPYDKGFRRSNVDKSHSEIYNTFNGAKIINKSGKRYPRTILEFNTAEIDGQVHPTQKPVALFKYLIKTYSNKNDIILDNCIGSGTTAVACKQLRRNFMGCDDKQKYVDIANKRLEQGTLRDIIQQKTLNGAAD